MRTEGLLRKSLTGESIRSKVCEERVKSEGEVKSPMEALLLLSCRMEVGPLQPFPVSYRGLEITWQT